MKKKEDARITKTKKQLRAGLVSLLRTKPFEKISVREICAVSKVNKMTFYKHYDDKYDLLDDCAKVTVEQVIDQVRQAHGKNELVQELPSSFALFVVTALDKVLEVKDVLLSLSSVEGNFGGQVVRNALAQSVEVTISRLMERLQINVHAKDFTAFFVGGFANLAMKIVHDGQFDHDVYFRSARELCKAFIQARQNLMG